ncbi:MAG: ATP-binding cassette domain-containing protein [Myxococcales bacterium]|nr:ATP-binding cassette domain-containing protein [Myxococcales bacterium]
MSTPIVECRGLTVGYDKPVLEGIDLTIEAGEIVALLGGSGCGKSTLLRCLIGLLPPLGGEVRVLGESLYELSLEKRHQLLRRTGTAFQQDALFGSMSVADNVALPLHELTRLPAAVIDEMVELRLGLVGLAGLEERPPASLSGGQRKRAALARASILDPDVMFCDEPSAGLDPAIAAAIDATLLQFRAALGITIVVVTHEIASIEAIADRAVMFARGGIVAAGTIKELEKDEREEVFNFFHRVAERPQAEMTR